MRIYIYVYIYCTVLNGICKIVREKALLSLVPGVNLVVLFSDFHPGFLTTASLDSFASLAGAPSARPPWAGNVLRLHC